MSRRFRLVEVPGAPGGFEQVVLMPPPCPPAGEGGSGPCTCADLAIQWPGGIADEAATLGDGPLVLVAQGDLCPDVEWTLVPTWDPEAAGAAPAIEQVGAAAWQVTPTAAGILSVAATATCGGATLAAGSVTLTVIEQTYSGGGGGAGWVDVTTLPGVTFEMVGDPTWTVSGGHFVSGALLDQVGPSIAEGYTIHGLDAGAGAVYARLRVRVVSFSTAGPYPGYIAGLEIPVGTEAGTEYITDGPVALADFLLKAGANASGDQAGSFDFQLDVEIYGA